MNGSELACWLLGYWFENGISAPENTLKRDDAQAAKWYRKMPHCGEGVRSTLKASLKQEGLDWLRQYDEAHPDQALHHALFGGAAAE